tara:strand:- start:376 stop:630 length:255 start_codon:yes stop_codon:yes gene_type:complete
MNKVIWIAERFVSDIRLKYKGILMWIGLMIMFLTFGKILHYYDLIEFYLPVTMLLLVLLGIYKWYSIEWDMEQKKIVDKLKGNE